MNRNINTLIALSFILLFINISKVFAQYYIDIESGTVFSGYNDVQIPRNTGTRISLSQELTTDPAFFYRLRLTYTFNKKHTISALYAPLKLYSSGNINRPVIFEGVAFPANIPLKSTYIFNSYRLTYRYDFIQYNKMQFGLGFTAKIRDAAITLESEETISRKLNVGFVPIINFNFQWTFTNTLSFLLNGDALGAPQGRAEDVLTAIQYNMNKNVDIRLGYRILEGGANVEQVYNFTLINYLLFGVTYRF
jgi:hypothetical protein